MPLQYIKTLVFLFLSLQLSAQKMHNNSSMKSVIDFDKNYYFAQAQNNLWGLCAADASVVIEADYDTLYPLSEVNFEPKTFALTYTNSKFVIGKQGRNYILLDLKGNKKMRVNGIMPRLMRNNVILVQNEGKWGLGQTSGEMLVATTCTAIDWFDDLLGLQVSNQWVLFHPTSGELAYYDHVSRTNAKSRIALLFVEKDREWGLIDGNMKQLIPMDYQSIQSIIGQNDLFIVEKENKFGIYNITQQKMVFPVVYDGIELSFDSTKEQLLISVQQGNEIILLDLRGNAVEQAVEKAAL